jgi:hypothetical protein
MLILKNQDSEEAQQNTSNLLKGIDIAINNQQNLRVKQKSEPARTQKSGEPLVEEVADIDNAIDIEDIEC